MLSEMRGGKDLIVLPEGVTDQTLGWRDLEKPGEQFFFPEFLKIKDSQIILSGQVFIGPSGRYNAMMAWGQDGLQGIYKKRVLFLFGEYFPVVEDLFPGLVPPELRYIPGGAENGVVSTSAGEIGIVICQEINFQNLIRADVKAGAELLATGGSEWQFGKYVQEEELRIARMRAVESNRFFIRAMKEGTSAIIDPLGRVLARPKKNTDIILLEGEVKLLRGMTPYVRYGDAPVFFIAAALLLMVFHRWRRGSS
jgi:apolipoprotein N-acyltransferase